MTYIVGRIVPSVTPNVTVRVNVPPAGDVASIVRSINRAVRAEDPHTPTDADDPVPQDEEAEEVESGAFMGDRPDEPSEDPDPDV